MINRRDEHDETLRIKNSCLLYPPPRLLCAGDGGHTGGHGRRHRHLGRRTRDGDPGLPWRRRPGRYRDPHCGRAFARRPQPPAPALRAAGRRRPGGDLPHPVDELYRPERSSRRLSHPRGARDQTASARRRLQGIPRLACGELGDVRRRHVLDVLPCEERHLARRHPFYLGGRPVHLRVLP